MHGNAGSAGLGAWHAGDLRGLGRVGLWRGHHATPTDHQSGECVSSSY